MAYAVQSELEIVGVGAASTAKWSPTQISTALDIASAFVDTYLAKAGYTLPLGTPSPALKRWTCIVAAYDLMVARGYQSQLDGDVELRKRYEQTVAELKALTGDEGIDLGDTTEDQGANTAPIVVSDELRGYMCEDQQ